MMKTWPKILTSWNDEKKRKNKPDQHSTQTAFIFSCTITNYHKLKGLKQLRFIISLSGGPKLDKVLTKVQVSESHHSFPEAPGENLFLGHFHLLGVSCISQFLAPFFHLHSQGQQVEHSGHITLTSAAASFLHFWWPSWLHPAHLDNPPPHLKVLNEIISVKSLVTCKATYSQTPGISMWISLGEPWFCLTHKVIKGKKSCREKVDGKEKRRKGSWKTNKINSSVWDDTWDTELSSEHYSERGAILSRNVFKRVIGREWKLTTKSYE